MCRTSGVIKEGGLSGTQRCWEDETEDWQGAFAAVHQWAKRRTNHLDDGGYTCSWIWVLLRALARPYPVSETYRMSVICTFAGD